MIKNAISLARRFANTLNRLSSWLGNKNNSEGIRTKFLDLAPTDKADSAGVYSEALWFATNNSKVFNIALTGPYGSGKSSIIQSFLKKYRRPALHISLAAFVSDANSDGVKVSRQEIERSILQQMLYGADANKIPLSRFKRIQSPSFWSIFRSLYITLGVVALWYVFTQRADILSGAFFIPFEIINGVKLFIFAFAAIFLWMTLHHFYIASFGLSLKSISLKDVEIRPAYDDQTSILNRHLDEILYFFQSTNYDLVIIEDLDRFNDSEIFVTLREINSLVNENAGVKRAIRFLYALRDDMFVNTDRTKFFEFIIPVIPIINASNSIDMVLQQGRRLALDERFDRQFLREVSRYLNDLRLIQNIFNEYAIYVANLETDGDNLLDPNKLLAILIYKNVYPRDFEQLHRGVGNLAEILNRQDELIRQGEAGYRDEIEQLERELEICDRQMPADLAELRKIYAMALIEKLPAGIMNVGVDRQTLIPLAQISSHNIFERLIEATRVFVQYQNNGSTWIEVPNLQAEVDSRKSYLERKKEVEGKGAESKSKALRRIQDLRSKIPKLRIAKLNELLRLHADHIDDLFKGFEENGELARFLILEGHVDDTYYQYTSLFHSGRLSPNDNKFLIQIRAFITPEPNFPLDNPKEVIAAMRDEDFQQSYVLNVKLVDSLLDNSSLYLDQTRRCFDLLSSEFESCEEFLSAYYASGRNVSLLLLRLVSSWKNLVPVAIASGKNISHVTQLIANLPISSLKALAEDFGELSDFVAANLSEILLNLPGLAQERLACLNFEVKDLTEIKEHSEIVRFMVAEGRYTLTIANLEYAYQEVLGQSDLNSMRSKNFTTIRSMNNSTLKKRVERDFNIYVRDVLLELPENSVEDVPAILFILDQDSLEQDVFKKFLERQTTKLPKIESVSEKLHPILFQLHSIEATWMNCLAFMESGGFEADVLTAYLCFDDVRRAILQSPIPSNPESLKLRQFLLNAGSMPDAAYTDYVRALPHPFQELPEGVDETKLRILILEKKITLAKKNFDALDDNEELQKLYIATNIDAYLADPLGFALDDEFLEGLLRFDIDNSAKLKIVELMDLNALGELPERAALIGSIIGGEDALIPKLGGGGAQSIIINSEPIATQISLFNKYHVLLSDEEVRHVLANMPRPFSEIKTGYGTPRLKNNPENRVLVQWLESRSIISSWRQDRFLTDDIRVNLFRR